MPIFTCGHQFSPEYCHWDAVEHTKGELFSKIIEHAKETHSRNQISYERLTFTYAIDVMRLKLQDMEKDLTRLREIRLSSPKDLPSYPVKQARILRWKTALQTCPRDELEWMLIEETKMENHCPLHLVINGIRTDFPVPHSCTEAHCPHRFNCFLYHRSTSLSSLKKLV
jgi:predicted small metal-binding protein